MDPQKPPEVELHKLLDKYRDRDLEMLIDEFRDRHFENWLTMAHAMDVAWFNNAFAPREEAAHG